MAAKEKAIIPTVPVLSNVVTDAFRLRPRNTSAATANLPPPILIRLASPAIKLAIFKAKKDSLPSPTETEKQAGTKRFHLAEDLTTASYNFLMDLREDSRVERAWSTDGQVRFTIAGDRSNFVHKVKSVFATIDSVVSNVTR